MLPISFTRTIGALTKASAFGVVCTFYVSFVVIIIFFADRDLVPNILDNFANAQYFVVSHLLEQCA